VFNSKSNNKWILTVIIVDTETSINIMEGKFFDCYFRMEILLKQSKKLKVTATNRQPMMDREKDIFGWILGCIKRTSNSK
jgi:hypothetical protein